MIVCRDRDEPGHRHADQVVASLAGIARTVILAEPAEGKDVTDHLDAVLGPTDLRAIKAVTPETAAGQAPARSLVAIPASSIKPRRIRWLWHQRIVLGGLTLFAGREGLGKSTLAVDLAARTTRGELDGELSGKPRAVITSAPRTPESSPSCPG